MTTDEGRVSHVEVELGEDDLIDLFFRSAIAVQPCSHSKNQRTVAEEAGHVRFRATATINSGVQRDQLWARDVDVTIIDVARMYDL